MSGETGTSDSGHGGSEEDLHAKTGQAQETGNFGTNFSFGVC